MMAMEIKLDNKLVLGVIGTVLLLCGFGGSQLLDKDTVDNAYVCNVNDKVGIFEGNNRHPEPLSDTKKSGYYINEFGEDKYSICRGGIWMPLIEFAKMNGVDPNAFLLKVNEEADTCPVCPDKECPSVNVIAYVPDGYGGTMKYYCDDCTSKGCSNCISDDEIMMPFER
jgi:hypothetical protein